MVRLPRPLRLALILLAAGWALYLVVGNLFLNTAMGPQALNRHPERLRFAWSHATTWYPGQVTAHELRIEAQVRTLQWQARAAQASGRIALWPLLKRELRLPSIDVDQVEFVLREVDTALPPREAREGGWRISLPQIHTASLRALQWNDLSLRGDGHARVALSKQLRGGAFELGPSVLGFVSGELRRDDVPLLRAVRVHTRFELERHRPEQAPGREKLRLLRAAIELDAQVTALALALDERGDAQLAFQPGDGHVDAALELERGDHLVIIE